MAKFTKMDDRITIKDQLEENTDGQVILISSMVHQIKFNNF